MADIVFLRRQRRRVLRRERVFRDRIHPLDKYDDVEIYNKFRFRRHDILQLTDDLSDDIEIANRAGSLSPVLQVLLTLRFFATGSFVDVCGELIGVDKSTACRTIWRVTGASRTIWRVTGAILPTLPQWIRLPNNEEARQTKQSFFFTKFGFPNTFGCVDGTHIPIKSPGVGGNEHEFINRKGHHSINVQVICDADLFFINVDVRWPGSVHDARILRESAFFDAMEGNHPPVQGIILGDSGYMLRDWLMTPILNPANPAEENYSTIHCRTRNTIERAIGVAKKRWHCLHHLRIAPERACKVITACLILHNRARFLSLPDPDEEGEGNWQDDLNVEDFDVENIEILRERDQHRERARFAAGRAMRNRLVQILDAGH